MDKIDITENQMKILEDNVYRVEEGDLIYEKYHGCGAGWVEINKDGEFIDLKYLDSDIVEFDEVKDMFVIPNSNMQNQCLLTGQEEQNVNMLEFHLDNLVPLVLPNGNIRVLVNLYSYELVRFCILNGS